MKKDIKKKKGAKSMIYVNNRQDYIKLYFKLKKHEVFEGDEIISILSER